MLSTSNVVRAENQGIVFFHHIIMWMFSVYLLADIVSGFFVIQLGVDVKVSLMYKSALFVLLLMMICRYHFTLFIGLLIVIFILLISPVAELFRSPVPKYFIADISSVIKIVMPVSVFIYLKLLYDVAPKFTGYWIRTALWSNLLILMFNLGLGALGFGRSSYALADDNAVGSNGFIYAANELGATLIVLFGFALHMVWNHHRRYYLPTTIIALLCGVLVATKTAMLAAFLLIFLIPVFNERQLVFRLTWLKIKLFIPALILVIAFAIFFIDFLQAIGLYDHVLWIFSQEGIVGVLWSGRDVYSANLLDVYFNKSTLFQQFFGQGSGGVVDHIRVKYAAEVDAVDSLVWFGFFGVLFCLASNFYFIFRSSALLLKNNTKFVPCVLLANLILLFLSQLSGHVWMSGTLGISLGLLNGLLLLENDKAGDKC